MRPHAAQLGLAIYDCGCEGVVKLTISESTVAVSLAKFTSPSTGKDSRNEKQASIQHCASFGVGRELASPDTKRRTPVCWPGL
jgi:hypothetical protein